jgi:hypothetical protein
MFLIGLFSGMLLTGVYCIWFLRALVKGRYVIFEATPKLMGLLHNNKKTT